MKETKQLAKTVLCFASCSFLAKTWVIFLFPPDQLSPLCCWAGKQCPFHSSSCNEIKKHTVPQQKRMATQLKWRQHRGLRQSVREGGGLFFPFRWEHHWTYSLLQSCSENPWPSEKMGIDKRECLSVLSISWFFFLYVSEKGKYVSGFTFLHHEI